MAALQIISVIALGISALLIHRTGVARSLRAVGSIFWAAASAFEKGAAEFRASFAACMERAR